MEEGGAKRIVIVVAIAAVAIIGVFWYWQRAKQRALGSGNVYVKNSPANDANPSTSTSQQSSPASPPESSDTAEAAPAPPAPKPSAGVEKNAPAQPAPAAASPISKPELTQPRGAIAVPVGDTIARNPPTGLAFAGSGKYQLYRQGDITWRLDTDTGLACIIFATDMQWSRVRVWDSGCGAS